MTAQAFRRYQPQRKSRSSWLPLIPFVAVMTGAGWFVSYELRPSWPSEPVPLDGPALPVTVAGVLFNVPPAAFRVPVQRHPGAHERLDLVFLWPSLMPPDTEGAVATTPVVNGEDVAVPVPGTENRLFVTIAVLGTVLAPSARLRTIYPRYIETQATAGPDGLAIVPFRAGTPYEGEDLIYLAEKPEQFFTRCLRVMRTLPSTCIHERSLAAAEITLRFPRAWLQEWRSVAAGFDRLVAQLHPSGG